MNEEFVEVDLDKEYLFQISEETSNPDYRFATSVSEWIHDNLEALTDDNDVPIFNKISYMLSTVEPLTTQHLKVCIQSSSSI